MRRTLLSLKMRVLMHMYCCKAKAQYAGPRVQVQASHAPLRRHDHSSSAAQPKATPHRCTDTILSLRGGQERKCTVGEV
jgi:hypothetical protein